MLSKHLPPWKSAHPQRALGAGEAQASERSLATGVEDKDYDVLCLANDMLQAEIRRLRKAIRLMAVPVVSQADASTQTARQRQSLACQSGATQTEELAAASNVTAQSSRCSERCCSRECTQAAATARANGLPRRAGGFSWADQFEDEPLG